MDLCAGRWCGVSGPLPRPGIGAKMLLGLCCLIAGSRLNDKNLIYSDIRYFIDEFN